MMTRADSPHQAARLTAIAIAVLAASLLLAVAASTSAEASDDFRFEGRGWGHGIGMSQYGARSLAENGRSYRQIIAHYYTNASVGEAPSTARPWIGLLQDHRNVRVRGATGTMQIWDPSGTRLQDVPPGETWTLPQLTGYGSEVKTQMTFAVEHLKKKGEPRAVNDILGFLSLTNHPEEHKRELIESLRGHPRVDWKPDASLSEQTWRTGTYEHRPIIPGVKDGTSLLAHLQRKTDASGVSVRDLKDGWPDCEDTLAALEAEHKVLVVRTKKDNFPRFVWPNDPSLHHTVEAEFQSMWHRVPIPDALVEGRLWRLARGHLLARR
jgi:hypothetical protein